MKLGVYTVLLANMSFEEALIYLTRRGIRTVEIGCGGFSGTAHADPDILLYNDDAFTAFTELLQKYEVNISALNCSGNPVHPQKEIAQSYHIAFEKGVLLSKNPKRHMSNIKSTCFTLMEH